MRTSRRTPLAALPVLLLGALLALGAAGCGSVSVTGGGAGGDTPAYEEAQRGHTARAYARYLEKHPAGAYARQARHWAERLAYFDALASRDPRVLEDFLCRYPQSGYASDVEVNYQRAEYQRVRSVDTIEAYRAFVAQFKGQRSEWTESATQRLERLLLDRATEGGQEIELSRYVHDNPGSPYLPEAREALRRLAFQRVVQSQDEKDWRGFLRDHPGTPEAGRVAQHMEDEALRGAERSGRVSALQRFLELYPGSRHKDRVQTALQLLNRGKDRRAPAHVKILNAEVEVYTPPKCSGCKPVLRVHGTLHNTDADFSYDLVLEAQLKESAGACCLTRHRERGLRPGERRPFAFPILDKTPSASGRPPGFEVRVAEGLAREDRPASQRLTIPGLGTDEKAPPADTFRPERVPPLR